ncbi:MAG: GAF domain-containing protein [Thiomargarita sp.]|nr:GAF domain-containing protein [Thiomargarita sp.]
MMQNNDYNIQDLQSHIKTLTQIGVALSAERNGTRLLEMILIEAKRIAHADGGTLYTRTDKNQLTFETMLTKSLNIHSGGTSGIPVTLLPLQMYQENGAANLGVVAVRAAICDQTINIPDVYANTEFEFSGMRKFDKAMNYHSQSFLTVPMKNHEGDVIGILQLINALDPVTGEITEFSTSVQELVESLASQASVAWVNQRLLEEHRHLFEAFIKLIATAIDEKSPHTGGHCQRVPKLAMMLVDAVSHIQVGPLKDFNMTEEGRYELKIAALLHDCGKITTPEYIIEKSTKLETIFDRIDTVDTRFEVLKRDAEIELLRKQLAHVDLSNVDAQLAEKVDVLNAERDFIRNCNLGGEFMSNELKQRVKDIAQRQWIAPSGQKECLLSEKDEVYNLNISKGTLTPEERQKINYHIEATIKMLETLPYPKHLKHVPEYAGGHHERMDGKGYPKHLKREQLSLPARLLGVVDVFEALTARDRPYNQKPKTLSQALRILGFMKLENHIDPDLFDAFIHEKVYERYAHSLDDNNQPFLLPTQIDEVDVTKLPGYSPLSD